MWILWIQIRIHNTALSCQKYGFGIRDLGSGKNLFRIPDPGVKKAPDPGSGSATLEFIKDADMDLDGTKGTNGDVKGLQIHF